MSMAAHASGYLFWLLPPLIGPYRHGAGLPGVDLLETFIDHHTRTKVRVFLD